MQATAWQFSNTRVSIKQGGIYPSDMAHILELWQQEACTHMNVLCRAPMWATCWCMAACYMANGCRAGCSREHLLNFNEMLRHCDAESVKEMIGRTRELLGESIFTWRKRCWRTRGPTGVWSHLYRLFAELGGVPHYIRSRLPAGGVA